MIGMIGRSTNQKMSHSTFNAKAETKLPSTYLLNNKANDDESFVNEKQVNRRKHIVPISVLLVSSIKSRSSLLCCLLNHLESRSHIVSISKTVQNRRVLVCYLT